MLEADWLIACDGAGSPIRKRLGLAFEGRVFEDNFLIADVRMTAPFPGERRFWFEPSFTRDGTGTSTRDDVDTSAGSGTGTNRNAGASALLHKQPDDVWRIDFQLGWDIDRARELEPARIHARVGAMLGERIDYALEWSSIYTFQCRRMRGFRHGRVLFAGDSAHQVSPFGARGANSGFQDAENLAWKLDAVLKGIAPERLLDSYSAEREHAADENILASSRTTDFLTPKSDVSRRYRDAVLGLARTCPFARPLINSGRLSVPAVYDGLPLNGPDALDGGPARTRIGAACRDAPLGAGFLLERLGGGFTLLAIDADVPERLDEGGITVTRVAVSAADDPTGALAARYLGGAASAVYLIRPDQHVAARWARFDEREVRAALRVAVGRGRAEPDVPRANGGPHHAPVDAPVDAPGDVAAADPPASDATANRAVSLILEPNIEDGDGFYDELLHAHDGLDRAASDALNARLVLLLCNHVGDGRVIGEALRVARGSSNVS